MSREVWLGEQLRRYTAGMTTCLIAAHPRCVTTAPTEWHGVSLPTEWQQELQRRAAPVFEAMILASATPEGMPDEMRLTMHDFKNLTDNRFVQGQEEVAAVVKQHGRQRLEDIMLATAYTDIRVPVAEASHRLGLEPEQVGDNWRQILEAIPSRWGEMKLRQQRQANPQRAWQGNDLNDVTALAIAVSYCDVVVTETSWASLLSEGRRPLRPPGDALPSGRGRAPRLATWARGRTGRSLRNPTWTVRHLVRQS